jgi:sulfofructosephosphate aldolase
MGLDGIAEGGRFCVLAIDHRDSLRSFLSPDDLDAVTADELTALKIDIIGEASHLATGVMLEPEFSIPQVLDAGALAPGVGFCAALESQGYLGRMGEGATRVLDGWSVEAAKASGASACKLLLPFHPDRPLAAEQQAVAVDVIAECRRVDMPLVLEPLFYDLDDPSDRRRVVMETTRRFAATDPHLLKLPFPVDPTHETDRGVWADACAEMGALIPMPWTLLSGGGDFELFFEQVEAVLAAGASGCMVGRALWGEAARCGRPDRVRLTRELVVPRMQRLRDLVLV